MSRGKWKNKEVKPQETVSSDNTSVTAPVEVKVINENEQINKIFLILKDIESRLLEVENHRDPSTLEGKINHIYSEIERIDTVLQRKADK